MSEQITGELNAQQQLSGYLNNNQQLTGELNNIAMTYESIIGKPQINGETLVGNKTTKELKISHKDILGNYLDNLHPINAVIGLQEELSNKATSELVNEKIQEVNDNIDYQVNNINNELVNIDEKIQEAKKTYVYSQMSASKEWNINHNLDKNPSVTVVDSAGTVVTGEIKYIDNNNIKITFSGIFSGKAFLN